MSEKMAIKYVCARCGADQIEVEVRFRRSSEDVVHWMEHAAIPAVAADHIIRSPWCRAKTVDLKIPVPEGAESIGGRVLH